MTYDEEGLGDGYLDSNILLEVKKLHVAICQYLFEMNKEKEHGVVPNPLQMRILKYLKREEKESIYQKDIQKNLDVSKAAISAVIKSMEKKKLIQKCGKKLMLFIEENRNYRRREKGIRRNRNRHEKNQSKSIRTDFQRRIGRIYKD